MKEYKLLKKYPSLPKDWEVGMIVGYGDRQVNLSPCSGKYSDRHISDSEVINHPEYWEEVIEKDYEVLSFKGSNGKIWNKLNDDVFQNKFSFMGEKTCKRNLVIHSVKRLSDNEIFTLGDIICFSDKYGNLKIEEIIEHKDNRIELLGNGLFCDLILSNVNKVRQPLFITYDNVSIYDEDELLWDISTNNWDYLGQTPCKWFVEWCDDSNRLAFSTEIAAKTYIKEYRPHFSLNDIKEAKKKLGCLGDTLIEYLETWKKEQD